MYISSSSSTIYAISNNVSLQSTKTKLQAQLS